MARFKGVVGFANSTESPGGVWSDTITERAYSGHVLQFMVDATQGEKVNDDLNLREQISIMADPFALEHVPDIKFVVHMGTPWIVDSVKVERPRLTLYLGGVYDGNRAINEDAPTP